MITVKRWLRNWRAIFSDILAWVSSFWLSVKILSYLTEGKIDVWVKHYSIIFYIFGLIIIISIFRNKPKKRFGYKLRDKDSFIEIKVGDAFQNKGSLIVPINDQFDVYLGGNVKKAKSLQNKLITEYYSGKEEHLKRDIEEKIQINQTYEIGTTIEIEQGKKKFYLLVNSRKRDNNRVESTADDFLLSLSRLWEYVALESGRDDSVTIPLISTRHGRITDLNRSTAIKEIIRSYIESSKHLNIVDKLIISVHPDDLKKGDIDLDEIDDYLKFSCLHYRHVQFDQKVEGQEIKSSEIKRIEN